MNVSKILDDILDREGRGVPPYLAPHDAGGRTSWGISERAHPEAWHPGPGGAPTRAEAKQILLTSYVVPFVPLAYEGDALLPAVIDDAVLSGAVAATKRLQWVLGVTMDGVIGPQTIEAVKVQAGARLLQRYVVERAVRLCRQVQQRPSDLGNLTGWVTRALSFLPAV